MCTSAAEMGHLEMLQWAVEKDCDWDARVCVYAAQSGHLEVLQWARQNGCDWDARLVCKYATENRHLEVLKGAHERMKLLDHATCMILYLTVIM